MNEKDETISTYQQKNIAEVFDKERNKYLYQRYKHKIESNLLKKSIQQTNGGNIKILDVACGTGRMLPEIFSVQKGIEYIGFDTSKNMTQILKEKAEKMGIEKNIKIKIGDATKLPFENGAFDMVFTYHLLWHIPPEEQEKIIKEMFRVCKNGGVILFDLLNKNFLLEILKNKNNKDSEGLYKLKIEDIKTILDVKEIEIEKINDAIIKKDKLYKIFNVINIIRKVMPSFLYHMIYIKIRKNV